MTCQFCSPEWKKSKLGIYLAVLAAAGVLALVVKTMLMVVRIITQEKIMISKPIMPH